MCTNYSAKRKKSQRKGCKVNVKWKKQRGKLWSTYKQGKSRNNMDKTAKEDANPVPNN